MLPVERAAMQQDIQNKRNITAKDAIRILHENGVEISEKEAEKLLDLMYFFGKLTVNQYINDKSTIDIDQ